MDDLITEFIAETREMLEALERGLVAWERQPDDRERLDEIFRFVHTVKGNCGFFDLPRLEALAHAAEDTLGNVRAGKRAIDTPLVDAVLAVIDRIAEIVETIAQGGDISGGEDSSLIAMLGQTAPSEQAGEALPLTAPNEPPAPSTTKASRVIDAQRSVRLPTTLIDRVMSGVSDMILVRNELERQLRDADNTPALTANFGRLSALLSEVQAAMSRVRMQPIQTLLGGYDRMIRDIAADLGKQVEVEVESGQVELDRELVELLRDPLLHIIRNAIDHGIETPDERRAAGKPVEGRLLLSARQTGNEIRIAILDDGRGIDPDKVTQRAIERGIVTAEQAQQLDRGQKLMLICEPGLSTAPQVTAISGRGVGMDVVRSAIERMGGELRIISVPGDGSRFLIDVPLTLSIVPSITVEAGGQVFAVPRSYVREIVRNGREIEVEPIGGLRHVRVRGELHICVGLGEVLGIGGEHDPERQTLVIIRMIDGTVFALCVDRIADHCDLVIRPVAPQVIGTGMYVGVAQLTDGRPSLMLDLAGVAQGGGIRLDKHARAAHQIKVAVEERSAQLVEMIVFNGLDGVQRATPLTSVERLIEVALADIGQGGGHPHIVFGDAILPLHGFARGIGTDSIDVVVLSSDGTRLAYATAGAVDTADIDLATATGQAGRRLALLEGRTVELLDLGSLAGAGHAPQPTCRLPGGDVWSREVLRPLVEAAGYRVVDDGEADADIEIQLSDDCAEIAGDTLLVGSAGDRGAPVAAIARDDHAALAAALRAANNRRAG